MNRRDILAAAELTMGASALTATTYGLITASYDPYAAVSWVPIAAMGLGTAAVITVVAALLFAGKAALLLADNAARARQAAAERLAIATAPPPSATAPLWPRTVDNATFDTYVAERAAARHHARHGGNAAPEPVIQPAAWDLDEWQVTPVGSRS